MERLAQVESTVSATEPSAGSVNPRFIFRPDSAPLGTINSHSAPFAIT